MRKQTLRITLALSLVAMMALASTYGVGTARLQVSIPFPFVIGDAVFDAGEYIIASLENPRGIIEIRAKNSDQFAFANTIPAEAASGQTKSALEFHRYGDQNYLSKVWLNEGSTGMEVIKSKGERAAAKSGSPRQVVLLRVNQKAS